MKVYLVALGMILFSAVSCTFMQSTVNKTIYALFPNDKQYIKFFESKNY